MTGIPEASPLRAAAFGLFLVLLSGAALYFARDIRVLDLGNHDPGPRTLPVVAGTIMLLGGVAEIIAAVFRRRERSQRESRSPTTESPDESAFDVQRAGIIAAGLLTYIATLTTVGFAVGTILFATWALWYWGLRWWAAGLTSVAIVVIVQILFVVVFKVPLPSGSLMPG